MATLPSTPALNLRQYLTLGRLTINELPPHPELAPLQKNSQISLPQFLRSVFAEVRSIDFDEGWTNLGDWPSEGKTVEMPPHTDGRKKSIPISVTERFKTMDSAKWLARRSYHSENDVKHDDLDRLLNLDHSLNEARYTPSVYDANMLLTWTHDELREAAVELHQSDEPFKLQMSIFQMFHTMPPIYAEISPLQDRVFHVLVISGMSTYNAGNNPGGWQKHTVQLPIDFDSLKLLDPIVQRSHIKKQGVSLRYHVPPGGPEQTDFQKRRVGRKITEGNYVSLERLQKATEPAIEDHKIEAPPADTKHHHRWDMMTLSTASGITSLASGNIKNKKILEAIATDVYYVLKYIADVLGGKILDPEPEERG